MSSAAVVTGVYVRCGEMYAYLVETNVRMNRVVSFLLPHYPGLGSFVLPVWLVNHSFDLSGVTESLRILFYPQPTNHFCFLIHVNQCDTTLILKTILANFRMLGRILRTMSGSHVAADGVLIENAAAPNAPSFIEARNLPTQTRIALSRTVGVLVLINEELTSLIHFYDLASNDAYRHACRLLSVIELQARLANLREAGIYGDSSDEELVLADIHMEACSIDCHMRKMIACLGMILLHLGAEDIPGAAGIIGPLVFPTDRFDDREPNMEVRTLDRICLMINNRLVFLISLARIIVAQVDLFSSIFIPGHPVPPAGVPVLGAGGAHDADGVPVHGAGGSNVGGPPTDGSN